MNFTFGGNEYNYIYYSDLKESDLPEADIYGKTRFLSLNCGFDIETSSIKELKRSFMYVWQFAINDITVIGRTWSEFREFLNLLSEHYNLSNKRRILCWIHNSSYEFQFLKNQLYWNYIPKKARYDIFAMEDRKIIKFVTSNFIEFRDSLVLTGKPLKNLAKDYKTGLEKLPDYNYNIIMTPESKLHLCQLAYCINDVQILARFNQKYIKPFYMKKNIKIPLTVTGIPRNELKMNFKKVPKFERNRYKRELKRGFPDMEEYEQIMRWLYRGGYVHANASTALIEFILEDMASVDFKSSYPASLLHENYARKFITRPVSWFYKYGRNKSTLSKYSYYGEFELYGITARTPHTLESKNKIMEFEGARWDNGRLNRADYIKVLLTEQDYLNYIDMYEFEEIRCNWIKVGEKEPLPKFFKDMILKYFIEKETLPKGSLEQLITKGKLNSLYGMCCTSLFNKNLNFNVNTGLFDEADINKEWSEIIDEQILIPFYGIWCAAYSRRNLIENLVKVGWESAFYCDTDSIKLRDYTGNRWVFDSYNDRMDRINSTMYVGEYDRKYFKNCGKFEYEGKLLRMKFAGAKRYIYTYSKNGVLKTEVVVAGMRKGTMQRKCEKENLNIYEEFNTDFTLEENESDKITSFYYDEEFTLDVVDSFGSRATVHEKSCIVLYEIPFKMTIAQDYIKFVEFLQDKDRLRIGERYL